MGDIIQFPNPEAAKERKLKQVSTPQKAAKEAPPKALKKGAKKPKKEDLSRLLKEASDRLDCLLLEYLESGRLRPHELAGLLAHRLGHLISVTGDKDRVYDLCEKVLKQQAIDK